MSAVSVPTPSGGDDRLRDGAAEARVCDLLIQRDRLKAADLERARRLHAESPDGTLMALLTRLGLVAERDLADAWCELLDAPFTEARQAPDMPPEDLTVSPRFLRQHHVVPLAEPSGNTALLVADPGDAYAREAMELACNRSLDLRVGLQSDIDDLIERYYGQGRSAMGTIVENLDDTGGNDDADDDVEHLRDLASETPVIRLVNLIVQRAVEQRASDIHIEPFESRLKVRYRVDGVLTEVEAPPASSAQAVISRVKIMARLDIAERRLPQDGRIQLRVQGKELDLRVSTIPTAYGESVVMRILDRESVVFHFDSLGFTDAFREKFVDVLERPNGILLVTGPTGSGKSTTLYTALQRINTDDVKIITVEDPVEYQLEGINQIQAKPSIGLDFAGALRSIVRQDPDVIMIGEMRDLETCRIAIQSALTGHLVLSTLHTNSAAGGVTRLLDMGVEDYLLGSTVNGILAQRLVRRLDPETAQPYEPDADVIAKYQLDQYTDERPLRLYKPGSSEANPNGFHGRQAIMEFVVMTEPLRRLVMQHADAGDIEAAAREAGMRTMYEDGIAKALAGVTTLEEVERVTQED